MLYEVITFLNHQLDAELMDRVGQEIALLFRDAKPTRILTAEVSGIAPAMMAAKAMGNRNNFV